MVCFLEGALEDSLKHAEGLETLARPRRMNGFVARALWVRSLVAQTKGIRGELDEAIVLARMSGERPLLWALLALADSGEAQQVFEEMGQTIRDQRLRESFRATVSSGFTVGREPATGAQSQEEVPHDMDAI